MIGLVRKGSGGNENQCTFWLSEVFSRIFLHRSRNPNCYRAVEIAAYRRQVKHDVFQTLTVAHNLPVGTIKDYQEKQPN